MGHWTPCRPRAARPKRHSQDRTWRRHCHRLRVRAQKAPWRALGRRRATEAQQRGAERGAAHERDGEARAQGRAAARRRVGGGGAGHGVTEMGQRKLRGGACWANGGRWGTCACDGCGAAVADPRGPDPTSLARSAEKRSSRTPLLNGLPTSNLEGSKDQIWTNPAMHWYWHSTVALLALHCHHN